MWSERERQSTERGMLSSASLSLYLPVTATSLPRETLSARLLLSKPNATSSSFDSRERDRLPPLSPATTRRRVRERESLRGVWRRTVGLVEGIRDPLHSRSQGARETFAYSLNQKQAPAAVAHQQTESESRWPTHTQRQTVGRGRAKERARERERNGAEADDA